MFSSRTRTNELVCGSAILAMKKLHLSFEGVVLLSVPFCDIATPEIGTVLHIQLLILQVCDMRSQSAPI